jgi:hypothetical protein
MKWIERQRANGNLAVMQALATMTFSVVVAFAAAAFLFPEALRKPVPVRRCVSAPMFPDPTRSEIVAVGGTLWYCTETWGVDPMVHCMEMDADDCLPRKKSR